MLVYEFIKRSPDLNLIEKYWAWARARLRAMDLKDAVAKRRPLGKMTYRARVLVLCRSSRGKTVASKCFGGLRKVCLEVVSKTGAASRG